MDKNSKTLKSLCLASLVIGVLCLIAGAVLAFMNMSDPTHWLASASGLVLAVFGVRSSIMANVPSKAKDIRTLGLIIAIMLIALAVCSYMLRTTEITQIGCVLCAVSCLFATVQAHRLKRELDKV